MHQDELATLIRWCDEGCGHFELLLPMVGQTVAFTAIPADRSAPAVTERMAQTLRETLALGHDDLLKIEALLWEECRFAFETGDYGIDVRPEETRVDAHLRAFELAGPRDALRKAQLLQVYIHDDSVSRFVCLETDTVSGNRICVIIKNGRIVDFDDSATLLNWFENEERYAHKRRQVILSGNFVAASVEIGSFATTP